MMMYRQKRMRAAKPFDRHGQIGFPTGKFTARRPVGGEQLTSFQYRVYGEGRTRP